MRTIQLSELEFDEKKVLDALQKHLGIPRCPISGHTEWSVVPGFHAIQPLIAIPGPITSGRMKFSPWGTIIPPDAKVGVHPGVMLVCDGCGYVALFSAVKLGLVAVSEKPPEVAREKVGA